jgi:hypothetical protein
MKLRLFMVAVLSIFIIGGIGGNPTNSGLYCRRYHGMMYCCNETSPRICYNGKF